MSDNAFRISLIILTLLLIGAIILYENLNYGHIVYDCRHIEFYQSVPKEVLEECIRIRLEEYEQKVSPPTFQRDLRA